MSKIVTRDCEYTISEEKLNELIELSEKKFARVDLNVKNQDYNVVRLDEPILKIHDLVFKLTPPMSNDDFEAFLQDVATNGQLEPIKIWRKRGNMFIVDGRNRYNALNALGIEYIKYVEVKFNTLKELESAIISWDKRRNTTKSQKAIIAYFDYKENGGSMDDYAFKYGVNKAMLSFCNTVLKKRYGSEELLLDIKNKGYTEIGGSKINSLTKLIKALDKLESVEDNTHTIEAPVGTAEGIRVANQLVRDGNLEALAYLVKTFKNALEEATKAV